MFHKALNNYSLTLNGSIDSTVTAVSVIGIPATLTPILPVYMSIEGEILEITAVNVNVLTVVRGIGSTDAADHANGATLNLYIVAEIMNEVINVLENPLDPVLNGVVSGTAFLDEDDMISDSETKLASQQSIKRYVDDVIGGGLVLGETDTTAYRGDRGAIAFNHSQLVVGNPHAVTKSEVGLGNVDNTSDSTKDAAIATLTNKTLTSPAINTPTGIVKGDVGLGNVDNTSDANKPVSIAQQTALNLKLNATLKGAVNGLAELDAGGLVPSSQLPSYVDDVLEYANFAALPVTGETGKIYVTLDNNLTYRWSGAVYVEISSSLALGETSSTAYRGDRGATAYNHSQLIAGNPHAVTKSEVGLGNVDNTSDATKNAAIATLTNKTLTSPAINTPTGIVKGDVGLGNVDNTSDSSKNLATVTLANKTLTSPILNGIISGDAFLDEDNMVSDSATKLASQQSIKKYVDDNVGGGGLTLGETDTTAYRGDRGAIAYNHSQLISVNPHAVTKSEVGLGNVDNTSDTTKDTAIATLTNKTLTSPAINTPTGIVKGDVGLGNVDNTSDSAKNAATATLTNKTLEDATTLIADNITPSKTLGFELSGAAISTKTTIAANQTVSRTLSLPDATDTLVGKATTDTLTNKTLTSPTINTPTGIVKGDVGLGNVDNTSDSTKDAAIATLTNKTLTSPTINTPTGIVKGDVGLGNVDNTSDSTKDAAIATLTNKTLTSPAINAPTGIVKGDVGLGSVDNTSDATKNAAAVTLANKTLTSPILNGIISGDAFLDEDDMVSDSATKLASQQSIKKYVDDNTGGAAAATKEFNVPVGSAWTAATAKVVSFTCTNVTWEVFHVELTWVSADPLASLSRLMVQANFSFMGRVGSSALLLGSATTLTRANNYTPGAFGSGSAVVTYTVTKSGAPTATVDNLYARVVSTSAASVGGLTVTIP